MAAQGDACVIDDTFMDGSGNHGVAETALAAPDSAVECIQYVSSIRHIKLAGESISVESVGRDCKLTRGQRLWVVSDRTQCKWQAQLPGP